MATEPSWEIFGAELMEPQEPLRGRLTFSIEDCWILFDVARERQLLARSADGMSSILLGSLELHVAWPSGQFLYPIGYFGGGPDVWSHVGGLAPPAAEECGVRFKARGIESNVGISFPYVDWGEWETQFDPGSGWLVYRQLGAVAERAALFADNCIAGLAHHQLVELWLQPEFIDPQQKDTERRSLSWLRTLSSRLKRKTRS